ncbi:T9SS type A sorting domain-containing protein [bacterium]|nr:T9SS type A sorting domain-containing protein [bacterium]
MNLSKQHIRASLYKFLIPFLLLTFSLNNECLAERLWGEQGKTIANYYEYKIMAGPERLNDTTNVILYHHYKRGENGDYTPLREHYIYDNGQSEEGLSLPSLDYIRDVYQYEILEDGSRLVYVKFRSLVELFKFLPDGTREYYWYSHFGTAENATANSFTHIGNWLFVTYQNDENELGYFWLSNENDRSQFSTLTETYNGTPIRVIDRGDGNADIFYRDSQGFHLKRISIASMYPNEIDWQTTDIQIESIFRTSEDTYVSCRNANLLILDDEGNIITESEEIGESLNIFSLLHNSIYSISDIHDPETYIASKHLVENNQFEQQWETRLEVEQEGNPVRVENGFIHQVEDETHQEQMILINEEGTVEWVLDAPNHNYKITDHGIYHETSDERKLFDFDAGRLNTTQDFHIGHNFNARVVESFPLQSSTDNDFWAVWTYYEPHFSIDEHSYGITLRYVNEYGNPNPGPMAVNLRPDHLRVTTTASAEDGGIWLLGNGVQHYSIEGEPLWDEPYYFPVDYEKGAGIIELEQGGYLLFGLRQYTQNAQKVLEAHFLDEDGQEIQASEHLQTSYSFDSFFFFQIDNTVYCSYKIQGWGCENFGTVLKTIDVSTGESENLIFDYSGNIQKLWNKNQQIHVLFCDVEEFEDELGEVCKLHHIVYEQRNELISDVILEDDFYLFYQPQTPWNDTYAELNVISEASEETILIYGRDNEDRDWYLYSFDYEGQLLAGPVEFEESGDVDTRIFSTEQNTFWIVDRNYVTHFDSTLTLIDQTSLQYENQVNSGQRQYLTVPHGEFAYFFKPQLENQHGVPFVQKLEGINEFVVSEHSITMPHALTLNPPYPSPFNSSTSINYSLPTIGWHRIAVFDLLGREISVLKVGVGSAGLHKSVWDGLNQANMPVASGTYYIQLETGGQQLTKQVIYLK